MKQICYIVCDIKESPDCIRGLIKQYVERNCNIIYTVATMYCRYSIYRNNPP